MNNFYLHFISSISPILLPFIAGLCWVFSGNFFWVYLATNTIIFGELANVFIKKLFKNIIPDEPWALRPNPCAPCNNFMTPVQNKESVYNFGFPSGHSQNVGVFCALLICYILHCHSYSKMKSLGVFLISIYVGWSRMQLQCHNLVQVSTGIFIGYYLGFCLWKMYVTFNTIICKKNL